MSVVINGAGIVGLFLARILAKLTKGNVEIYIIERYSQNSYSIPLFRKIPNVIALSRGAYFELEKINVRSILPIYSTAINQIEISEYTRSNTVCLKSQDYQISALGYVIEINPIKKELFNILSKQSVVHIYQPAVIQQIYRKKSHNLIVLDNGERICSQLMIAADGSCSGLATFCGIRYFKWNYQQTAIITEMTTENPHCGTAFEKFTVWGPLAVLPMYDSNVSCVIWCIATQKRKEASEWSQYQFIQKLQKIFGWKLGKILDIKTRYFHDLWLIYAKQHITHRLALVGNAAQTLHPVAGQGFNLGIRDAIVLAQIIYQSLHDNIDLGNCSILELYQKSRQVDQCKTIMETDGLIRIFSNHYLPLVIARNLGLFFFNHSSFLKQLLVNRVLSWNIDSF